MFAKSVLITGCSRGIGLELVKQLADQTEHLFATCRSPNTAKELKAVADHHKNVVLLELDITNEESIKQSVGKVSQIVQNNGLNCLINNAGVLTRIYSLENASLDIFRDTHETNVIGPVAMIQAYTPLLKQASSLHTNGDMTTSRASVINISTCQASNTLTSKEITKTEKNLSYAYRMSKAALNMLTTTLSIEFKRERILVVSIHPGWAQTDMGGSSADVTPTQSVDGMLKVAKTLDEKNTGMFYAWNGDELPW